MDELNKKTDCVKRRKDIMESRGRDVMVWNTLRSLFTCAPSKSEV